MKACTHAKGPLRGRVPSAGAFPVMIDLLVGRSCLPSRLRSGRVTAREVSDATTALEDLVGAARVLAGGPSRRLLGIVGAPGAGKSVFAAAVVDALAGAAVLVGMDGFHLAQAELDRLGRAERKGAPDTFDAAGYVALLRRLRDGQDEVVYAPRFDRALEEPVAGAVAVPRSVPLVVTEGNYLLHDGDGFAPVAGLLDACWYVEVDEGLRVERLVARHVAYGRSEVQARGRALGSDQRNADVIVAGRARADRVVRPPRLPGTSPRT